LLPNGQESSAPGVTGLKNGSGLSPPRTEGRRGACQLFASDDQAPWYRAQFWRHTPRRAVLRGRVLGSECQAILLASVFFAGTAVVPGICLD
jgi:hypothetical protein